MRNLIIKLKKLKDKRLFHFTILIFVIISILLISLYIILDYDQKGEKYKNIPYVVEKVNVISSTSTENISDNEEKWEILVSQTNDIYLYISKNDEYTKTQETIKKIKIDNFQINSNNENIINIYKPNAENVFINSDELKIDSIEVFGAMEQNIGEDKISNTGDIIKFRISQQDIYKYVSDIFQNDTIDYNYLLKNSEISEQDLEFSVSFDIQIILNSNKVYTTSISLKLPIEGFIEEGKSFLEISEKRLIFKRQ